MTTPLFPAFRARLAALGQRTTRQLRQTTLEQLSRPLALLRRGGPQQPGAALHPAPDPKSQQFKVLEFGRIAGYKLTDVNDEIIAAHPFSGRGLTAYGSFVIENSPWLKEVEMINKSHPQFEEMIWQNTKHYMLCFKDRMFEALAMEVALAGEADARETAITIALNRLGPIRS